MNPLRRILALARNLIRRDRVERDLDAEVASYVELLAAEKVAAGMTPDAARRAARLDLEGADHVKEQVREARAGAWLELAARDVRHALRSLRRTPGFTGFTVMTFGLAIGGITVIFSLVNAVLLRPLPYPASDRLVAVLESNADDRVGGFATAAPNYLDWERQSHSFSRMALYEYLGFNLSGGGKPELVGGLRATGGLFDVLGVRPFLGRGLTSADDEGANGRVVVLSHRVWQRRYGADSSIVGTSIMVNREPTTVVGVMPRGFVFPGTAQDVWVPIALNANDKARGSHSFFAVARLKPGVGFDAGRAEMRAIGDRLAREYPGTNAGESVNVIPLSDLWVHDVRTLLQALMAAVVLVLLIASANIASLLVARGSARRRELAARIALGGSKSRIVAQLVTESLALALGGAVVGLGLASVGIRALVGIFPPGLRYVPFRDLSEVSLDPSVFLFAVGVSVVAGIAAGIAPALAVLPAEPGAVLRDTDARGATSRRGGRLRNLLVAAEVGLAVVVLVGAGLLLVSIDRVRAVDPGFEPRNVLTLGVQLPQPDFYGPPVRPELCQSLAREVGSVPGVVSSSATSAVPLTGAEASRTFTIEGRPDPGQLNAASAGYGVICPGYFRTMAIPMSDGRDFEPTDRAAAPPVAIINESMRRRYFPSENPVGRRFHLGTFREDDPWITIIAVVGDVRHSGLQNDRLPYFYRPYSQAVWPQMHMVARTATAPAGLVEPIQLAMTRIDPDAPVGSAQTMTEIVEASLGHLRFPVVLFSAFALMAVTLAAIGIFGVASQSVVQRRRELGIRRALGARDPQLYRMVIGQAMGPVAWGIGAGVLGGLAATRILRGVLFAIEPTNPPTFAVVSVLLALVALVAALVPARSATRIDPAVALRDD